MTEEKVGRRTMNLFLEKHIGPSIKKVKIRITLTFLCPDCGTEIDLNNKPNEFDCPNCGNEFDKFKMFGYNR